MGKKLYILCILNLVVAGMYAQQVVQPDFKWGNGSYYNLNFNDTLVFEQVEIRLLKIEKHYNQIQIGNDTLWLKVARNTLPEEVSGIRVFVADNRNVKALVDDQGAHALLKKDILICLSRADTPLLDPAQYQFPVSFNDGFRWSAEEDSHPFSFYKGEQKDEGTRYFSYPGLGIDLHDARASQKHWLVAVEESRVAWVESAGNEASVLLESKSQPGIYYVYSRLFSNNIAVKKGQELDSGDLIGTAWGDQTWGHAVVTVIKPEKEPLPQDACSHVINGFPYWYELYFQKGINMSKFYSRGRITFGKPAWAGGNRKNTGAYTTYTGKGWIFSRWNPAEKVESETNGEEGLVKLSKVLFVGTPAQCTNPSDYFEYVVNVRNGTYRIRAKVGHFSKQSWQEIEFEGVPAGTRSLKAGEMVWTSERAVQVTDGTLNVKIYIDPENKQIAGISEIVFQQAF